MELDTRRKLIIGALDPRHTDRPLGLCRAGGSTADPNCKSGFYVISYANPKDMKQIGDFVELPSGHTSSCIQNCKYIWTGGPARRSDQLWLGPILSPSEPAGSRYFNSRLIGDGRPIWVTDLTNPYEPQVSDMPVDIWRNDGYTDYSHDVDEDDEGIAWVSGRGGIRGYATKGTHRDPYLNQYRKATPFEPVLVGGGGVAGTAQPVMLMHNSGRPMDGSVRASGVKSGNILVGTEEEFTRPCEQSGKIVFSDLTDSWGGEPAELVTRGPLPDEGPGHLPSVHRLGGDVGPEPRLLGALLRGRGPAAGRRLVRPGLASGRHLQRAERAPGRLLPDHVRHTGRELEHVGRRVPVRPQARRPRLRVRRQPRSRGTAHQGWRAYASKSMKKVTAPSVKSAVGAPQPVASLVDDGGVGFICPLFEY